MTAKLAYVQIGDLSIGYRQAGRGAPLVLLHGFLCDSRCWSRQLAELAAQFHVIAWDAPGAGSSSDPSAPFTLADWSHCLAKFLDALDVPEAHLVGLSWGGVLAQEFYRRYAGRIARLVLADTYAGWRGSLPAPAVEQRLLRCERDSYLAPKEFASRWVAEMFSADASPALLAEMSTILADFHPRGFRLMARSLADADTTDVLPRIGLRTLVLWGEHDRRSSRSIAEQLRNAVPGAELQVIARAGHVSNMEQPDAFSTRVRDFCLAA